MVKNKLSTVMDGATDRSVIVNKFAVLTSKLQCFIQPPNTWINHESWEDTWRARSASLLLRSGGSPQRGPELKPCSLRASHGNGKLPHSLYFANSIHIGLLCIFDVFRKNNYGEMNE